MNETVAFEGPLAVNDHLKKGKVLFHGELFQPETLVTDEKGKKTRSDTIHVGFISALSLLLQDSFTLGWGTGGWFDWTLTSPVTLQFLQ